MLMEVIMLLTKLQCEALPSFVHLINKLPSNLLNHVSPYTQLFGHAPPYYSNLCTFGYVCYVHLPLHKNLPKSRLNKSNMHFMDIIYTIKFSLL